MKSYEISAYWGTFVNEFISIYVYFFIWDAMVWALVAHTNTQAHVYKSIYTITTLHTHTHTWNDEKENEKKKHYEYMKTNNQNL